MKQILPMILLFLVTPCSIYAYMQVVAMTGSELLGAVVAVALYALLFISLGLFMSKGKRNSKAGKDVR